MRPCEDNTKRKEGGKGKRKENRKKKKQSLSHLKTHALSISGWFGRKKVSKNNSQRPTRRPGTKDGRWVFKVFLTCDSCHGLQNRVVLLKFTLPTYYELESSFTMLAGNAQLPPSTVSAVSFCSYAPRTTGDRAAQPGPRGGKRRQLSRPTFLGPFSFLSFASLVSCLLFFLCPALCTGSQIKACYMLAKCSTELHP